MSDQEFPEITEDTQVATASKEQLIDFLTYLRCINCFRYVNGRWHCEDGKMHCWMCWDARMEEERVAREKEIETLKMRLVKLGVEFTIIKKTDS
jgi:hypothetical protein